MSAGRLGMMVNGYCQTCKPPGQHAGNAATDFSEDLLWSLGAFLAQRSFDAVRIRTNLAGA
jgi:hypothetical protein